MMQNMKTTWTDTNCHSTNELSVPVHNVHINKDDDDDDKMLDEAERGKLTFN